MKPKITLLLLAILLFKNTQLCLAQNANKKISMSAMPAYVKELQHGLPSEELKYNNPSLYNHLMERRSVLINLLKQQVDAKVLPKEALQVLQYETKPPGENKMVATNIDMDTNFHLVKDINTSTSSYPANSNYTYTNSFAVLNNVIYYAASNGIHGNELWRSDGTFQGTYMVKDIDQGSASGNPLNITTFKNKIYFSGYRPTTGTEIYQSDGTRDGTIVLKDIVDGIGSSYPSRFTPAGDELYFSAGSSSSQLWKTDGTKKGTVMVADLSAVNMYTYGIYQLTYANNILFFTAYSYQNGRELWRSDGTTEGTFMVKDINPINYNDADGPVNLTAFNHRLYFSADKYGYGYDRTLWESDGTSEGTKEVTNKIGANLTINSYGYYFFSYQDQPFAIAQNSIFFAASAYNTGTELYKYNPSDVNGISLVRNISNADASTVISTNGIRSMNDTVYFVIPNFNNTSYNLWKSAGSVSNTLYVKTLPGPVSDYNFYALGNHLYFTPSPYGGEPWISDGTSAGTKQLADINTGTYNSSPACFTLCNGSVYFSAFTNTAGRELWVTKDNVTKEVKDINTSYTESGVNSYYHPIALNDSKLLFTGVQPSTGNRMWQSDGTATGTSLVDSMLSIPQFFDSKNGKAYLLAYDNTGIENIFISDGTSAGTKKILSASPAYYITDIKAADNGIIFYTTSDNTSTSRLWRTDSTGISVLLTSGIQNISVAGNYCYFSLNYNYYSNYGQEPWVSDGTIAGTFMLADVNKGAASSQPLYFTPFGNKIVFQVYIQGRTGLCISDGTTKGTYLLTDENIHPNLYDGSAIFKGYFYFSADDFPYEKGAEVYRTDGTPSGTALVEDIYKGENSSYPRDFTATGNFVYFVADDGTHGYELWRTNGKRGNTELAKDIAPGAANSNLINLTAAGKKLYFMQNDTLWETDGSDTGTHTVNDPGLTDVTGINNLTGVGNKLFFSAYNPKFGYELYEGDASLNKNTYVNNAVAKQLVNTSGLTAQLNSNPFVNDLKVSINSPKGQELHVVVNNYAGQQMITKTITASTGLNFITLDAQRWTPGVYFVSVISNSGRVQLKAIK